jgi:hypothetical protein
MNRDTKIAPTTQTSSTAQKDVLPSVAVFEAESRCLPQLHSIRVTNKGEDLTSHKELYEQ